MAQSDDTASAQPTAAQASPTRRRAMAARGGNGDDIPDASSESESLDAQVARLQDDVKAILQTLSRMGGDKVAEGQQRARQQYENLLHAGEGVLDNVQDEFTQVERQIKDTIRQKPLTAVLSAMGIGFLIAVLTR